MPSKSLKNRLLTTTGDDRKAAAWGRLWRQFIVVACISSAVSLIAFSGYFMAKSLGRIIDRPVAEISVESDFNYVDRQQIMNVINHTLRRNFLSENLNKVKTELEKIAWIDNVVLSRRWPDHLHVKITEQIPIAHWSDAGFINHRGELVMVGDTRQLTHLPHLIGPVEDSVEMLNQYHIISKLFRKYDLEIASLIKSRHHRWAIELDNGWRINLGKGQIMEKIQRFVLVLKDQLMPYKRDSIAVIDMRYQHGLAVKWLVKDNISLVSGR